MAKTFRGLTLTHPCFSVGGRVNEGRVHPPISPGCNICCRFCDREISDVDIRPGAASMIITPQKAVGVVHRAVELCPDIAVAGIAGPGDTLAAPYALRAFRLIKQEFPDIVRCMSTNGLFLPEYTQEIVDTRIDTLTVAINTLDPEIQAQIRNRIVYRGKRYGGVEAAEILIEDQLKGTEIVSETGITIKINTMLVPEINADHIKVVAQAITEAGTRVCSIIPLIPQHESSWCSVPGYAVLSRARYEAEACIDVFRHCQRYRADAVGIPGGEDFARQICTRPVVQQNTFPHG